MTAGASTQPVVVVGGGQAGFQVAAALREQGVDRPVYVVGEEPGLPYQRPPLSKGYLTGKTDDDGLPFRQATWFRDKGIEVLTGRRVVRIDLDRHRVEVHGVAPLGYGHLVLATGARNRTLTVPGADLDGVVTLRTRAEASALRDRLAHAERVVVVGAGFIGLEVASAARSLGCDVTVLEALPRVMARALSEPAAAFFASAHERGGVRLLAGTEVGRVLGWDGVVQGVETVAGDVLAADIVVVGIGVVANAELAAAAGLPVADGIVVDAHLRTSDPDVSAVGDCASHPNPHAAERHVRLESVQNAVDQARCVASRLAGRPAPYGDLPWFWSEQAGSRVQMAGLAKGHDTAVVRGDPAAGRFSVLCYRDGRLVGGESINHPADHMALRRLLAAGTDLSPEEAADPVFDLKAYSRAGPAVGPRP